MRQGTGGHDCNVPVDDRRRLALPFQAGDYQPPCRASPWPRPSHSAGSTRFPDGDDHRVGVARQCDLKSGGRGAVEPAASALVVLEVGLAGVDHLPGVAVLGDILPECPTTSGTIDDVFKNTKYAIIRLKV